MYFVFGLKSAEINILALPLTLAASGASSAIIFAISNANRYVFPAVTNSGDLALARPDREGTRTGLSNLKARLALHYPNRHVFEMEQIDRNVRVTCVLTGEPC